MTESVRWIGFALGVAVLGAVVLSVVKTLVVPRRVASHLTLGGTWVRSVFLIISSRVDDYETKDRILSYQGPLTLLVMLTTWLMALWLAFALMLLPLIDESFFAALRESGSSILTLGFAAHLDPDATIVYFLAAATGLIVVALLIAYLPTLYGSFNRRERLVTVLQSRAGIPAWGPEILYRHQMVGIVGSLKDLYSEWEHWAADVAESHTNYPILITFRSPHPLRSWVVSLLAVLDSAALYLALCPNSAPAEARLCLRMGFVALREVADAVGIRYDPDPTPDDPIELTYEEYAAGVARMGDFPIERTPEDAWEHFHGWRVNYERIAYGLADFVVAPPAPWSGDRTHMPGLAIVPQRPANRIAGDPERHEQPKVTGPDWRLRG
jgi:hypothetical protein